MIKSWQLMILLHGFLDLFKKYLSPYPQFEKKILKLYFSSIFYRKKHIKKRNFNWIKEIEIVLLNKKEGLLKYKDFQFVLLKNDFNSIPLAQKYLYAALISYYKIPKYYLLFWDDLILFNEFFIEKLYDKCFKIKEGSIILDIGASIGWYACKISQLVGDKGKIIAIEPDPKNFYCLKKNIEVNKLRNIYILNLGVWSQKKQLKLLRKKYASRVQNLDSSNFKLNYGNFIKIDVDTIDNICSQLELKTIDLIKMDVEGAEIEALKGAMKILKESEKLKLIIGAYHETVGGFKTYKYLIPFLEQLNFKIFKEHLPYIYAEKIFFKSINYY